MRDLNFRNIYIYSCYLRISSCLINQYLTLEMNMYLTINYDFLKKIKVIKEQVKGN